MTLNADPSVSGSNGLSLPVSSIPRQARSERLVAWLDPPEDYNLEHYRLRHLLAEFVRTLHGAGVKLGELAPDFELTSSRGDTV